MNGTLKLITAGLLAALLTGTGSWLAWGRQTVSRAQVEKMIQNESPYVRDRLYILDQLEKIDMIAEHVHRIDNELSKRPLARAKMKGLPAED